MTIFIGRPDGDADAVITRQDLEMNEIFYYLVNMVQKFSIIFKQVLWLCVMVIASHNRVIERIT